MRRTLLQTGIEAITLREPVFRHDQHAVPHWPQKYPVLPAPAYRVLRESAAGLFQPTVNDNTHAINSDGAFGDIGRQNDFALAIIIGVECLLLLFVIELAVQGNPNVTGRFN